MEAGCLGVVSADIGGIFKFSPRTSDLPSLVAGQSVGVVGYSIPILAVHSCLDVLTTFLL